MNVEVGRKSLDARVADSLTSWRLGGTLVFLLILGSTLLAPPLAALLVFVWAWLAYMPLKNIGFKRPDSWLGVLVIGTVAGVALKLLMAAVVLPYLGNTGASGAYGHLRGNLEAFLIEVPQMIILAGLAEEVVYRGFLLNRLQTLFGASFAGGVGMVVVSALLFGPIHYFTFGYFGAVQATIVGVLFAAAYLLNGQRLWSLIVAHAAFDVFSIWLIYADLQGKVAHLVFP